jgi:hypothetical protein
MAGRSQSRQTGPVTCVRRNKKERKKEKKMHIPHLIRSFIIQVNSQGYMRRGKRKKNNSCI